jgi:hypothetical protein
MERIVNYNKDEGMEDMKKWRKRMKEKRQRKRDCGEHYSAVDVLLELLFWIPEVLFFPFRVVFWLFRGMGKMIGDVWDFIN